MVTRTGGELVSSGINAPGVRDLDIGWHHVQKRIDAKPPSDKKQHKRPPVVRNYPTRRPNIYLGKNQRDKNTGTDLRKFVRNGTEIKGPAMPTVGFCTSVTTLTAEEPLIGIRRRTINIGRYDGRHNARFGG